MRLIQFPLKDLDNLIAESGAPRADRLISGNPHFLTWTFDTRDADRQFSGVWQTTPGKWLIEYDEWEFCSILFGVSIITCKDGSSVRLTAGDSFVIEPGFSGAWEAIETTRKLFVVRF